MKGGISVPPFTFLGEDIILTEICLQKVEEL